MRTNIFNEKLFNLLFLWGLCLALNIIAFLIVRYKIGASQRSLALHYNVQVGVDLYGKGANLYSLPVIGLALTVINFTIYRALRTSAGFVAALSAITSLCLQIILLGALLLLVRVN